jgi:hypothetical protein
MSQRGIHVGIGLCLLLAGCVPDGNVRPIPEPAVVNPPMVVNAPPGHGHAAIRHCIADNRRDYAEVQSLYQRARQDHRINPAEAREFNAMDDRLRRHERALGRDGLTLAECEYIGREIAREREAVRRMSRNDPGVGQCRRDNQRAHADVMAMFAEAERAGRITQRERRRFDELQRRFRGYEAQLKANGLTLAECQALGHTLAADAREVRQMAGYR